MDGSKPADAAGTQAGSAETQRDQGEIVVTARLRSETASKTPAAMTVVSGTTLVNAGITNMASITTLVPDLRIAPGFLLDSINIRGVGTSSSNAGFEQQVGIFIDGAYYGNGHWLSGAYVDLATVEVLKGPQGVYFGKNTIAGALNVRTNNPGKSFEGYVKTGYGISFREPYGEVMLSGPLTDTLGIRIVGRASAMQGWARRILTGQRVPGAQDYFGRITLAYAPSDRFDANLKLSADDYRDRGGASLITLLGCGGPNNTPAPLIFWGPDGGEASCKRNFEMSNSGKLPDGRRSYTTITGYAATLAMNLRENYGTFTSITAANKYTLDTLINAGFATKASDGTGFVPSNNASRATTWSQELRFQSDFGSFADILVGAYHQEVDFDAFGAFSLAPTSVQGGPNTTVHDNGGPGNSTALFGEVQIKPTPTIELDLAARYTHERKGFYWNNTEVAPLFAGAFPVRSITGQRTSDNFSPQATLTWKPDDNTMVYAAYKTGFLAGGFSQTGALAAGQTVDAFEFGDEKVRGGEIGTKVYLLGRKLFIDLTGYYYRYTGLQLNTYDPVSTAFTVQNAGVAISRGVELKGSLRVGGGLTLNGSVNYIDSFYKEFIGACLSTAPTPALGCNVPTSTPGVFQQDFSGTPTDLAARWSGRLAADYTADIGAGYQLSAGAGITPTTRYRVAQFPIQPGYTRVDARVALDRDRWTLALQGLNLTNEVVCTSSAGRTLSTAPSEVQCLVDRGREVRIEGTVRF